MNFSNLFEKKRIPSLKTLALAATLFFAAGCKQEKQFNESFPGIQGSNAIVYAENSDNATIDHDIPTATLRTVESSSDISSQLEDSQNQTPEALPNSNDYGDTLREGDIPIEELGDYDDNAVQAFLLKYLGAKYQEQKDHEDSIARVQYTNEVLAQQKDDHLPSYKDDDKLVTFKELAKLALGVDASENIGHSKTTEVHLDPNQTIIVPLDIGGQPLEMGISNPSTVVVNGNELRFELTAPSIVGLPIGAGVTVSHKGADVFLHLGKPGATGIKVGLNNIGKGGPLSNIKSASIGVSDFKVPGGHTVGFGYQGGEYAAGVYIAGKFSIKTKNGKMTLQPIIQVNTVSPTAYIKIDF